MTLKLDQLVDKIKDNSLSLPIAGTGPGFKVVKRDLEKVLGDHFLATKYDDPIMVKHMQMRRLCEPMKAYRYNQLNHDLQQDLFESKYWVGEEKYNGWRIIATFIPDDGFAFFGGNHSDVDHLPLDYTEHSRIAGIHPRDKAFHKVLDHPFAFDTEAIVHGQVEMLDGRTSTNTLDAVKAILGCDVDRALELQKEHEILWNVFDFFAFDKNFKINVGNTPYSVRCMQRDMILYTMDNAQFKPVPQHSLNKKDFLRKIWRDGGEGIILKNTFAPYIPGSRSKEIAVKIKRTMSGDIGDDLDAFICGYELTPEWTKHNLIGGVNLGVYTKQGLHIIATVTSMPMYMRELLTKYMEGSEPVLNADYMGKVVVVDGQELSARNARIMHASVDWKRGFRKTKSAKDCTFELPTEQEEMF